jgi:hypothetical protein
MRKITAPIMLVIMLLCSCTPAKIGDKKETHQQATHGIAYFGIVPTLKLVEDGQGKNFIFTLKNQNDRPETLKFSSSLVYDYKIINQAGEVLKQRSKNIVSTPSLKTITLKQGEELVYKEDYYKLVDGLPKGSYTIEFQSTAKGKKINSVLDFEIK